MLYLWILWNAQENNRSPHLKEWELEKQACLPEGCVLNNTVLSDCHQDEDFLMYFNLGSVKIVASIMFSFSNWELGSYWHKSHKGIEETKYHLLHHLTEVLIFYHTPKQPSTLCDFSESTSHM